MIADLVGYIGGFFITISFIPQVVKSYRTKKVGDLSISMIVDTLLGTLFWLIYGVLTNGTPIVVMNSLFGLIVLFQLYLKLKYK